MKQLMELLGLDIPKWEGPTICESSTAPSESSADLKPTHAITAKEEVKKDIKKDERKRLAEPQADDEQVKEETVSVKRERAESPAGTDEEK